MHTASFPIKAGTGAVAALDFESGSAMKQAARQSCMRPRVDPPDCGQVLGNKLAGPESLSPPWI